MRIAKYKDHRAPGLEHDDNEQRNASLELTREYIGVKSEARTATNQSQNPFYATSALINQLYDHFDILLLFVHESQRGFSFTYL